ncbi:hypothetical protein V6N12_026297 [Hibiscus sabdariffa]|uniref:SS18 N-terminal domain-containing protein n=1 Tax=Hibiscus sabdariffa TaxID=183260 RepID=A0ABR2DT16_9ROSI
MEQNTVAAYNPNNVTTDHIQQYLDENKSLILKIVESQYSGKLSECVEDQARLQQNLMYLAAIADSQVTVNKFIPEVVRGPTVDYFFDQIHRENGTFVGLFPSSGTMQPGAGHQQAQPMTPHSLMASRASMLPDFVSVSSGGGRAIAGGIKLDVGSALGSPEDRETADDGN